MIIELTYREFTEYPSETTVYPDILRIDRGDELFFATRKDGYDYFAVVRDGQLNFTSRSLVGDPRFQVCAPEEVEDVFGEVLMEEAL